MKHSYHIHGMTCNGCRNHVEETLSKVEGVSEATVDLDKAEATIEMESHIPIEKFQEAFGKLTDLNLQLITQSVIAIQPNGEDIVTNADHIKEFILGADAKTYNQIKDHIEKQRDKYTQKPIRVKATKEEIEAGASEEYDVPIQFDQSNFFG